METSDEQLQDIIILDANREDERRGRTQLQSKRQNRVTGKGKVILMIAEVLDGLE